MKLDANKVVVSPTTKTTLNTSNSSPLKQVNPHLCKELPTKYVDSHELSLSSGHANYSNNVTRDHRYLSDPQNHRKTANETDLCSGTNRLWLNNSDARVVGLTTNEANTAIVHEIQRISNKFKGRISSTKFGRLQTVIDFLKTVEGAALLACILFFIIAKLTICIVSEFHNRWWSFFFSLLLILPYFYVNLLITWKLRQAEQIRPFAQINEALRVLTLTHPLNKKDELNTKSLISRGEDELSRMVIRESLWNAPSSTLISVYRDEMWKRVPYTMMAKGDIFKLRSGELFPTDAIRVELEVFADTDRTTSDLLKREVFQNKVVQSLKEECYSINANTTFDVSASSSNLESLDQSTDQFGTTCETPEQYSPKNISLRCSVYIKKVVNSETYEAGTFFNPVPKSSMANEVGVSTHVSPLLQPTTLVSKTHKSHENSTTLSQVNVPIKSKVLFNEPYASENETLRKMRFMPKRCSTLSKTKRQSVNQMQCHPLLSNSSDEKKIANDDQIKFSPAMEICSGLAYATFEATSYASLPSVIKFLERSVPQKSQDPWGQSKRRKTTFFEMIRLIRKIMIKVLIVSLTLSLLADVVWSTVAYVNIDKWFLGNTNILTLNILEQFLSTLYLSLSFMPLAYRVLIEVTDVWGNARLQSLFQWLQETRLPQDVSKSGLHLKNGTSSFSSSTSSDTDSIASSVDSSMSVSRLPLRNQFSELLAVLTQGLDGASNLLHTLNSTTSVVFVDKEGILTDTQRTVQEICVPETRHNSMPNPSGPQSEYNSPQLRGDKSNGTPAPTTGREGENDNSKALKTPSNTIKGEDKQRTAEIYEMTTSATNTSNTVRKNSHSIGGKVVFDVLPNENIPDGQRFENGSLVKRHIDALRPLTTIMAATKLPLGDAQYHDFSHSNWLFSLTLRDIMQSHSLMGDSFRECVCSLKSLCGVRAETVEKITTARLVMAFQKRIVKESPPVPFPIFTANKNEFKTRKQEPVISATDGSLLFTSWLLRSPKDRSLQLVCKGHPRPILRRSAYYFDGKSIHPMTRSLRRSFVELISQWKGDGLECLAFGYRPINCVQQQQCLYTLDEHSAFVIDPEYAFIPPGSSENTSMSNDVSMSLSPTDPQISQTAARHTPTYEDFWEIHPFADDHKIGDSSRFQSQFCNPYECNASQRSSLQVSNTDIASHTLQANSKKGVTLVGAPHHVPLEKNLFLTPTDGDGSLDMYSTETLLSAPSLQAWHPVSIFPGPRSSIGGAPLVDLCLLDCFTPGIKCLTKSKSFDTADAGRTTNVKKSNVDSLFINYNNIVKSIRDLSSILQLNQEIHQCKVPLRTNIDSAANRLRKAPSNQTSPSISREASRITHVDDRPKIALTSLVKVTNVADGRSGLNLTETRMPRKLETSSNHLSNETKNEMASAIFSVVVSNNHQKIPIWSDTPFALTYSRPSIPSAVFRSSHRDTKATHHRYCQIMMDKELRKPTFISLPPLQTPTYQCPLRNFQRPHCHVTEKGTIEPCLSSLIDSDWTDSPMEMKEFSGPHLTENFVKTKKPSRVVNSGTLIRRLVNKQIFMGMVALKLSTSPDLATRVASFHEAGIRFIYMSRENNKKTKTVGGLLGLETDWNCLISLASSPRGVVNVVGNVVVPSGIEDIRRHIKEVDDVPLQVSLFSDGTPQSMLEMIKILQDNGEVVTCVGSARRGSNFDLFDQANCSISVSVDMSPVCRQCLGRRCIGYINRHIYPPLSIEHEFASALTSLPCSLHIHMDSVPPKAALYGSPSLPISSPSDPRWLGELLYEAFKESRRIVDAIQQSVAFFVGVSTGFIAPVLLIGTIFHFPPFFRDVSLMATLLVFLPLISATFLYSPAGESIMKEFPLRLSDHEKSKHEIKRTVSSYALRFCPSSFACQFLITLYFVDAVKIHSQQVIADPGTQASIKDQIQRYCMNDFTYSKMFGGRAMTRKKRIYYLLGQWNQCLALFRFASDIQQLPVPLVNAQIILQCLILLFMFQMSFSFIDRTTFNKFLRLFPFLIFLFLELAEMMIQSLFFVPPTRNVWLLLAWTVVFVLSALGVVIEIAILNNWKNFVAPNYIFFIFLIIWILTIFIVDEFVKKGLRKKYQLQQKFLKLLFTTRLGMWSPK